MAKISWDVGDIFYLSDGTYGIVITSELAVMVMASEARGQLIWRDKIPPKATPVYDNVPIVVRTVLWAAAVGAGILPSAKTEIPRLPFETAPANETVEWINIADYLPYPDEEHFPIRAQLVAPAEVLPYLQTLRSRNFKLQFDRSKSQGLDVLSGKGTKVAHVTVFGNDKWLEQLIADLVRLATALTST